MSRRVRRTILTALTCLAAVAIVAGCGSQGVTSPAPRTVVGTLPKPTVEPETPASKLKGDPTAGKALGYAQLLGCLDRDGEPTGDLDEAVEATIRATRRFVRRQRSWFRRDPAITWFDAARPDLVDAVGARFAARTIGA